MKNIQTILFLIVISCIVFSCNKWDDFKKYIDEGEILYTGKMDSVKVYSGKERVMLTGLLKSDPKLTKIVISWDNNADSVVYAYTKQLPGIDSFSRTFPVREGVKSFKVLNFDANGNKSVDVFAVGTSYGNIFRRRMSDRPIISVTSNASGTTINWDQMDLTTGPQYTEIEYVSGGETKRITTPVTSASTFIGGVTLTRPILYRTIFKPDATCIDTFSTVFTAR